MSKIWHAWKGIPTQDFFSWATKFMSNGNNYGKDFIVEVSNLEKGFGWSPITLGNLRLDSYPWSPLFSYRAVSHAPEERALPTCVDTTAILQERGSRYGKFKDHAEVTQRLKEVLFGHAKAQGIVLTSSQKESLEMVCHKLGRIVNGDPNYADSWIDVAGYSQLVADELQGVER